MSNTINYGTGKLRNVPLFSQYEMNEFLLITYSAALCILPMYHRRRKESMGKLIKSEERVRVPARKD